MLSFDGCAPFFTAITNAYLEYFLITTIPFFKYPRFICVSIALKFVNNMISMGFWENGRDRLDSFFLDSFVSAISSKIPWNLEVHDRINSIATLFTYPYRGGYDVIARYADICMLNTHMIHNSRW